MAIIVLVIIVGNKKWGLGWIPKAQFSQIFCSHWSAIRKGYTRLWAAWCSYFCKHSTFQGRRWIKDDLYTGT